MGRVRRQLVNVLSVRATVYGFRPFPGTESICASPPAPSGMEFLLALWWFLVLLGLAVAALPLAALLLPRAPRRGAAFAPVVALAVLGVVSYWLGHVAYGPATLGTSVAVLVAGSLLARRRVTVEPRSLVTPMAVFLGAFALLVAVRALTPGIVPAGGEKFLDQALLTSILRADALPPEDVWFASHPVRYYYGGQLIAADLALLTDTTANYAYNLALAAFYATLVTTAFGLAEAIADTHDVPRRLAGLLGALLVGLGGNLATPVRKLLGFVPDQVAAEQFWFAFGGIRAPPADAVDRATSHAAFYFWEARYVIPDTLNPFPLWAYRNGDLNAYMLSTPFLLFAAALALATYRTPAEAVWRRRALLLGALPAVAGLLAFTSTWSLPTAVGLAWLALVFADAHPATLLPDRVAARLQPADAGRAVRELARTLVATGIGGVVALLGAAWAAPYLLFHTPMNRGVGFLPPRSPVGPFLLVHGVFLGAFLLYLAPRVRDALSDRSRTHLAVGGVALAAALAWLALRADAAAVAVVAPFLLAGWALLRARRDVGFEVLLLVAAIGLVLVVEFAYARVWPFDPNAPRWNTVYKVYMQVWVLWGTAAAVAVTRLLQAARGRAAAWWSPDYTRVAAAAAVILVAASATFPALALNGHFQPLTDDHPDELTLDSTRYVETYHPHEAEAIDWLDARSGQPTMVSRPGEGMYQWRNAPASLTGVPTLAGWKHEEGYRGADAYQFRVTDVRIIYTGDPQSARAVLLRHDVDLVYVGPVEREAYDVTNLSRIRGVSPAFRNANVTIYRVNRTALAGNTTAP